jgi:hypothetical protein
MRSLIRNNTITGYGISSGTSVSGIVMKYTAPDDSIGWSRRGPLWRPGQSSQTAGGRSTPTPSTQWPSDGHRISVGSPLTGDSGKPAGLRGHMEAEAGLD